MSKSKIKKEEGQQPSDSWAPRQPREEVGGGDKEGEERESKRGNGRWPVCTVTELPEASGCVLLCVYEQHEVCSTAGSVYSD